ncbi:MAG: hypothetical protein ACHQQ3_09800 [Gemmatimonadales bacterium]
MRSRSGTRDPGARLRLVTGLAHVVAVVALAATAPSPVAAQDYAFKPRVQWEGRADGVLGPANSWQAGLGANVPADYYVRLGGTVAAGITQRGDRTVASGRIDAMARYLLDPVAEMRWGPYAGAGFSAAWDDGARWRAYLVALLGIEGPARGGWRTAIEVGLGGGVRAGLVLRRTRSNGR